VPFSQDRVDAFWTDYHRRVLAGCAVGPDATRHADAVYRRFCEVLGWRVYEEVAAMLDDLRRRGIKTGVISNWTGDLEDVLRRVDLHDRFDVVIDSARFGHEKPHPEIFQEALRRSGIEPDRAIHVGDSIEHDVDGALGSGLRAVLLDREGRHDAFDRAPRVSRLDEIASFL
jgi:putative hydrolase of the HAD superfamily